MKKAKNEVRRINLVNAQSRNPDKASKRTPRRVHRFISLGALCIVLVILLSVPILSLALDSVYAEKILPGVQLGASTPLGGLSREDVRAIIDTYRQTINDQGIRYRLGSHEAQIRPYPLSLNPDISLQQLQPIITIDADATFDRAFAVGRSETFIHDLRIRLNLLSEDTVIAPVFSIDETALKEILENEYAAEQQEPKDAYFVLLTDESDIEIIPEKEGYVLKTDTAISDTQLQLSNFQYPSVDLTLSTRQATVTRHDAAFVRDRAHDIMAAYPYQLHAAKDIHTPTKNDILRWLTLTKNNEGLPRVAINAEAVQAYLESNIAPAIYREALQQKYEIKDGKVVSFQAPRDGQRLNTEQSIPSIQQALLGLKPITDIELPIESVPAATLDINGETLVLKEIIGKGVTNFRGSPTNRRANIANGIQHINGIIVKEGETFSLIAALGSIDEIGGYKPELVIKGTKTIPEYGGGLCQVSTTLFRAVAYAGLPVVERRNHSYRVSYYEPPIGFDATIYSPNPDFRFTNDTGHPILIQARVEGTKASVELWGINDGRRVEVDEPTVFNIKKASSVKYIETTDLKPGEKKCTERAHDGADAIFERRVYSTAGEIKKDIFKSHYVVWPAVCLVGKKEEKPQDSSPDYSPAPFDRAESTSTATKE